MLSCKTFQAMDNGLLTCADLKAAQRISGKQGLGPADGGMGPLPNKPLERGSRQC
jgi:hypothetical protein